MRKNGERSNWLIKIVNQNSFSSYQEFIKKCLDLSMTWEINFQFGATEQILALKWGCSSNMENKR